MHEVSAHGLTNRPVRRILCCPVSVFRLNLSLPWLFEETSLTDTSAYAEARSLTKGVAGSQSQTLARLTL